MLDTTALRMDPRLRNGVLRALTSLPPEWQIRVAVTTATVEEMLAHYKRDANKGMGELARLAKEFERLGLPLKVDEDAVQQAANDWGRQFEAQLEIQKVTVLPLPEVRATVRRLARGQRPSKKGDDAYRDTVIWLSVVRQAKKGRRDRIVFVSDNSGDFGAAADGSDLHEDLIGDLLEAGVDPARVTWRRTGVEVLRELLTEHGHSITDVDPKQAATLATVTDYLTREVLPSIEGATVDALDWALPLAASGGVCRTVTLVGAPVVTAASELESDVLAVEATVIAVVDSVPPMSEPVTRELTLTGLVTRGPAGGPTECTDLALTAVDSEENSELRVERRGQRARAERRRQQVAAAEAAQASAEAQLRGVPAAADWMRAFTGQVPSPMQLSADALGLGKAMGFGSGLVSTSELAEAIQRTLNPPGVNFAAMNLFKPLNLGGGLLDPTAKSTADAFSELSGSTRARDAIAKVGSQSATPAARVIARPEQTMTDNSTSAGETVEETTEAAADPKTKRRSKDKPRRGRKGRDRG